MVNTGLPCKKNTGKILHTPLSISRKKVKMKLFKISLPFNQFSYFFVVVTKIPVSIWFYLIILASKNDMAVCLFSYDFYFMVFNFRKSWPLKLQSPQNFNMMLKYTQTRTLGRVRLAIFFFIVGLNDSIVLDLR